MLGWEQVTACTAEILAEISFIADSKHWQLTVKDLKVWLGGGPVGRVLDVVRDI